MTILKLLAAPILGGVFLITFPMIIIGYTLFCLAEKLYNSRIGYELSTFTWEPVASFLKGRK